MNETPAQRLGVFLTHHVFDKEGESHGLKFMSHSMLCMDMISNMV